VIDRASRLVTQLAQGTEQLPPIALDEVIAGLLDARFDVIEREAGLMLCGERTLMQGARRSWGGRVVRGAGTGNWARWPGSSSLPRRGTVRVVVVTAAAGMGKSRLAAEFVSQIQQRGEAVAIWVGRGDSLRAGSTLDLLGQALRGALGIQAESRWWSGRDKLRARVAEHVR